MKITLDRFNTEIFIMKMGNINFCQNEEKQVREEDIGELEKIGREKEYKHLTVKIKSPHKKTINEFLKRGYMLADVLVEYCFDFSRSKLPKIEHKCKLEDCKEDYIKNLKEIAGKSFIYDRFHTDPYLNNENCDKYYERWIENSYHGFADRVITAIYNNEPIGFTTGKVYPGDEYGHLVLSAVSNKYRGLGVYTSMIHEGVSWLLKEHGDRKGVIVGTQVNNLAVQKAWIKLGFSVYDSSFVLQKYIGE